MLEATDSVLASDFHDFEIIVVDDGSTDDTADVVRRAAATDSRVVLLENGANRGIQFSLNHGLAAARGKFIARLDADDEWADAGKLASQIAFLDEHPECVAVGTGAVVTDATGKELFRFLKPLADRKIRQTILGANPFVHGSVVMRTEAVRSVGGYDTSPETRHVEDYDLWLKLGKIGQLRNLPVCGLRYALSPEQVSSRYKIEQFRKGFWLMKKYRKSYPGYARAYLRHSLRLLVYGYLGFGGLRRLTARLSWNKYEI